MKKSLLTVFVAAATCIASVAQAPVRAPFAIDGTPSHITSSPLLTQSKAPSVHTLADEENYFTIMFCNGMGSWFYLEQKNRVNYDCYLYITPEMATQIAGNKITDIAFSSALDLSNTLKGSVWVAEDLEADRVTETECTVVNSYAEYQKGNEPYQIISLDEPYTIKAGVGFYFGYTVKDCKFSKARGADYPVGVDYQAPNGFSGEVDVTDASGELIDHFDMATAVGTNLFIAALTVGPHDGFKDMFMLGNAVFDKFALPVFRMGVDPDPVLYIPMANIGSNALTSVVMEIDINGEVIPADTYPISIAPGKSVYLPLEIPEFVVGRNIIKLTFLKVNDADVNMVTTGTCIALDSEGYDRKFVVEEGTGAWCGNCPRGIAGFEYMAETYPDKFIGIAVHSGDDLEVDSYQPFIDAYISGFPESVINRDPNYIVDPNGRELATQLNRTWAIVPAPASIELSIYTGDDDDALTASATTTFCFDETDASYSLAFVILEDGLYEYQENYYSGYSEAQLSQYPGLAEWGSKGSSVLWKYNHTARDIFDCFGLADSMPATIVNGQPMTYVASLPLDNVDDVDNTDVVALLIDNSSGTILNAVKVNAANYNVSGVNGIEADTDSTPAVYYDLQGCRIDAPAAGSLVIRVANGHATKIVK